MSELKPCPFCGGDNIRVVYYDPYDGYQGNCGVFIARCTKCPAQMQDKEPMEVCAMWNRRVDNEI